MPVSSSRLVLVLLALLLAGCTAKSQGSPTTAPTAASTTGSPSGVSTTLAPRPREITLEDVNPCDLWTPEQLTVLAVGTKPVGGGPQADSGGYQVCTYHTAQQGDADLGYSVTAVTDLDASVHLGDSGGGTKGTAVEVSGFPAVRETVRADNASPCLLAVSTARGQHLQVRAETRPGAYSIEQACEMTLRAATFAVQTLQTLR